MNVVVSDLDTRMSAIAFAGAGGHDTARKPFKGGSDPSYAGGAEPKPKKPYLQALVCGVLSISAYILVFKNEDWVTTEYTLGGWHALLPVGTAIFFSFVHGAFASNVLTLLGLEAKKK